MTGIKLIWLVLGWEEVASLLDGVGDLCPAAPWCSAESYRYLEQSAGAAELRYIRAPPIRLPGRGALSGGGKGFALGCNQGIQRKFHRRVHCCLEGRALVWNARQRVAWVELLCSSECARVFDCRRCLSRPKRGLRRLCPILRGGASTKCLLILLHSFSITSAEAALTGSGIRLRGRGHVRGEKS